ncbi:hypothetical protein D082_29500 [Synechocystis sp. PCC 6714]|nr:hypothetical protein D082_29500 [Synechocystis sp. PCC 6714]
MLEQNLSYILGNFFAIAPNVKLLNVFSQFWLLLSLWVG